MSTNRKSLCSPSWDVENYKFLENFKERVSSMFNCSTFTQDESVHYIYRMPYRRWDSQSSVTSKEWFETFSGLKLSWVDLENQSYDQYCGLGSVWSFSSEEYLALYEQLHAELTLINKDYRNKGLLYRKKDTFTWKSTSRTLKFLGITFINIKLVR